MKNRVELLWLLLCLTWCTGALAQPTAFLSATATDHPYQRGQWTVEQCRAWQEKYGPIRGINCPYPPCGAVSQKEALATCARIGYNSVRWWPGSWTGDVNVFIKSVEEWAGWGAEYGMTVSPVFGFIYSFFGSEGKEEDLQKMLVHVRQITRHFRGDDRIVMWDVCNEPPMHDAVLTPRWMDWIDATVEAMQEEGCTQPITASIVWDADLASCANTTDPLIKRRHQTEQRMDLHNFHCYNVQENFGQTTDAIVDRYARMDNRLLVCTECMTRTNGSTLQRSLEAFSKRHINFYSWGLYTCDSNWEVPWGVSNYYNNEPMFHNLLYADGDPYNPYELACVPRFRFAQEGEEIYPGGELAEVWSLRRAWKWMDNGPVCGLTATAFSTARTNLSVYARKYQVVAVPVKYSEFKQNANTLLNNIQTLADQAVTKGMRLMPILMQDADLKQYEATALGKYAYNVMNRFYKHRGIAAWCVLRQTSAAYAEQMAASMPEVMRLARYAAPNQPMFCAPLVDAATVADTLAADLPNLLWRMSDVTAFYAPDAETLPASWITTVQQHYRRPLFHLNATGVEEEWEALHVNWITASTRARELQEKAQTQQFLPIARAHASRWEGWEAWQWMNRHPVTGRHFASPQAAIEWAQTQTATPGAPGSLSVMLDYRTYAADKEGYVELLDSLLDVAAGAGCSVLPILLSDRYATTLPRLLVKYAEDIVGHFAQDSRILAWDLYHLPAATVSNITVVEQVLDNLFTAVRALSPVQPVAATPAVCTGTLEEGFDYIAALTHFQGSGGWDRLSHYKGDVGLTYSIWCRSDIICIDTNQSPAQVGWLLSQTKKFGRPVLCTKWTPKGDPGAELTNFKDMHVGWFADSEVDASMLTNYSFQQISSTR